jgi:hypothetical protein
VDRKHFSIVRPGMSPRSGTSPKHSKSTHARRCLRATTHAPAPDVRSLLRQIADGELGAPASITACWNAITIKAQTEHA